MKGYAALIAKATGLDDPESLALVEQLMREQTGGVLDHLSADTFAAIACEAYADAQAWQWVGSVNGVTLADYCKALRLAPPSWAA